MNHPIRAGTFIDETYLKCLPYPTKWLWVQAPKENDSMIKIEIHYQSP